MVEFVAQSVMASMQGISPDLTLAIQKTTIDTMLKNNAFVQAYTPDQLLQVGTYFTQAYLAQANLAPAGVPVGSAVGAA